MTTTVQTGISLRGLTKTFSSPAGPVHAVRGIDLEIAAGETVALLGPNGAGKSTTIDMLLGLLPADAGQVSVFGMPAKSAIRRGAIGAMLQSGTVLRDLTVREIIDMMGSLYPHPLPVADTLRLAHIEDIAARKTDKLSGGQSQRVRFAVALVSNPDVLVLDEPTVAMDVEARREFWATMREFAQHGKTVIFATHYLQEADDYADRIVLMANGAIVADGTSAQIKATVSGRTIRATLPDVEPDELQRLPGVTEVDIHGDVVRLECDDSDAALRALVSTYTDARDIEVTALGLEAAFVALTSDSSDPASSDSEHARGAHS